MRHSYRFVLVLFVALIAAAGCKPKAEPAAPAQPAAPAATPAPAPAADPAPAVVGEIGVAECDDYLRKWDACLSTKVTGEAREQVKVALDATREGWKRTAATPEAKAGLASACREAAELARMQVAAYGCTW